MPGYRIIGTPDKGGRNVGYMLSALYSPWVKMADLVYEWCKASGEVGQKWINGNLAEAWQPAGDKVDRDSVMKLCIKVPDAKTHGAAAEKRARDRGGYRLGEIPPDVLVLTGVIDVQRDRGYAEIVGWNERCEEAWLLWVAAFECPHEDETASFRALERIISLRLPFDDPHGSRGVGASRWAIDSGDGTRTQQIYKFARNFPGRVFACKGRHGDMAEPAKKVQIDKYPDGTKIPGGLTLFEVNTWKYKGLILGKLKQKPIHNVQDDEATVELDIEATAGGIGGRWWWPDPDVDVLGRPVREQLVEYFDQLTAEKLIAKNPKAIEKGKRAEYEWVLRPGRKHNHFLDCRVYGTALAEHEFGRLTRAYVDALRGGGGKSGGGEEARSGGGDEAGGRLRAIRERWKR